MIVDTGFVKVDNKIIRDIKHDCNAESALLYIILLSHKNSDMDSCYPSIVTLAEETNSSDSAVKRSLSKLTEHGYIKIRSGTFGKSNNYYFPKEPYLYTEQEIKEINKIKRVIAKKGS